MGRNHVATVLAVLVAISKVSASVFDFLVQSHNYDGIARVQVLASEKTVLAAPLAVVFITTDAQASHESEMLARILSTRTNSAIVYRASTDTVKDSLNGQVLIFRGGRRYVYHGLREALYIMKFISNLENANLKIIAGKMDKTAFDHTRGTKLVGYFASRASPDMQAFEQAASLFGNQISFYTTTDPTVAKHLKLNTTGQIYLIRDFDKHPVVCPVNPATLADIQQLIVFNRDSLIKVTPLNVLDPSLAASSAILLITDSSPFSFYLLKLIVRSQRQIALMGTVATSQDAKASTATITNNRVLWVDTNDFPTFDAVSHPIHGLAKTPGLGFWNSTTQTIQWMNLLILNSAPMDKIAEEANLLLVNAFLNAHPTTKPSFTVPATPAAEVKTEL